MKSFNNNELEQQIKELIDMIEEHEFHDMEIEYIAQLDKLKTDLSAKNKDDILKYINHVTAQITELKLNIIERFSIHNIHLTEEYMNQLIETDRILFVRLNNTTKSDDCLQYLMAKEQYAHEFKDLLLSFPEVSSLSIPLQNQLWNMSMHVAELNFLRNQHWTIKV